MKERILGFEPELRISPKPMIAVLVALSVVLFAISDATPGPANRWRIQLLVVLLDLVSAIAWLLDGCWPLAGRWLTVIALLALVHLGSTWLGLPGFLAWMGLPVVLAAALIGFPAAAAVAVGQTALLVLWPKWAVPGASQAPVAVLLMGIGTMLGLMYALYRSAGQITQWSWAYFRRAQSLLEEARDRQAELKQALDDLAHANLQLTRLNILAQGLRQIAEDARAAKQQFVANVSHELRTPLNMIVGFSEMIVDAPETYGGEVSPALLADLDVIHRNAEHLSDLIDDVLDLSQVETEQMALTKEYVRFDEIVETAVMAVRPLFDSKGLYLETEVPPDLPPVHCDRTRIREVLLNLLSNAGRFTERGGVRIRAATEGHDLVVAIADTGTGIAAEDMGKLFQPFHQLDGSIRRRYGGTGLGLSISKRFIELHGGKIWVESERGIGTTFFFRLPLAPPMPAGGDYLRGLVPDWEYLERTYPSTAPKAVVRPRFVVLERGDALQRLLTRYLDGVEAVPVTSIEEACQELSRTPAQALLVNSTSVSEGLEHLSDTAMPSDGTPAIVCSIPGTLDATDKLGVSEYLVKPVSRAALLAALDRLQVAGRTVLIVDDEPDALQLFGRMLASSERDYRILLARDGWEAMHILEDHHPDVILLDLIMPNMDGFRLLEARSHDPTLRDIPIVVVSARDPAGQPIVSRALAVTQANGLSAHQLLTSIEALSKVLSPAGQVGDPAPTTALLEQPACG